MKVAVIGLGYVGFPLACAMAKNPAYDVRGFDLDVKKIESIRARRSPIQDEQAGEDIKTVALTVDADPAVMEECETFVVCVPTPVTEEHRPDLAPVEGATASIARYLKKGGLVIIESTINPGVCEEVVIPILEEKTGLKAGVDFDLAHCPERINPGDPKWNVYNIPRNVGATTPAACRRAADFYRSFLKGAISEVSCLKVAEATKIVENTFRDINIAYVNELARSFDVLGIDLLEVIRGASNKPFAFMPHFPGCGVGGHCIPVDPYYLIERAKKGGFEHKFLSIAREVNNGMPAYTVDLLTDLLNDLGKSVKGARVGLLGISYKANVGDKRESPSLIIAQLLRKKGAALELFDPYFPQESTRPDLSSLLNSVEALVIATAHREFAAITPQDCVAVGVRAVVDGKNILDKTAFQSAGILYKGIGRG